MQQIAVGAVQLDRVEPEPLRAARRGDEILAHPRECLRDRARAAPPRRPHTAPRRRDRRPAARRAAGSAGRHPTASRSTPCGRRARAGCHRGSPNTCGPPRSRGFSAASLASLYSPRSPGVMRASAETPVASMSAARRPRARGGRGGSCANPSPSRPRRSTGTSAR